MQTAFSRMRWFCCLDNVMQPSATGPPFSTISISNVSTKCQSWIQVENFVEMFEMEIRQTRNPRLLNHWRTQIARCQDPDLMSSSYHTWALESGNVANYFKLTYESQRRVKWNVQHSEIWVHVATIFCNNFARWLQKMVATCDAMWCVGFSWDATIFCNNFAR